MARFQRPEPMEKKERSTVLRYLPGGSEASKGLGPKRIASPRERGRKGGVYFRASKAPRLVNVIHDISLVFVQQARQIVLYCVLCFLGRDFSRS